jgi:hypothetical protein
MQDVMRSVRAIAAGFFFMIVLGLVSDLLVMHFLPYAFDADGRTTDDSALAIRLGFNVFAYVLGGYVSARLGRRAEIQYALVLGCTLLAVAIPATLSRWDYARPWFHMLNVVMVIPAALVGGYLRRKQIGVRDGSIPVIR